MLLRKESYIELGADYLDKLSAHIRAKRLIKQLNSLGYEVQALPHSAS